MHSFTIDPIYGPAVISFDGEYYTLKYKGFKNSEKDLQTLLENRIDISGEEKVLLLDSLSMLFNKKTSG